MEISLLLLVAFLEFFGSAVQFKGRGACSILFEGCNILSGRCVCSRTTDRCYNTFSYGNDADCRQELFKQFNPTVIGPSSDHQLRAVNYLYPHCTPAQFLPICRDRHVGTKYCHGSCDKSCCVIATDGCLPPTNVYVPATSCAVADQDVCEGYTCRRGYKCESVKEYCPVLPCKKEAICIFDEDYDPCPMVTCSQEHGSKVCVRQRRIHCRGTQQCPFSFKCVLLASLTRPARQRNGCTNCPRTSTQESLCRNHFAVRVNVHSLIWEKRLYKTLGLCNWYNATIEYVLKLNAPVTVLRNATILVKSRQPDFCSCLANITPGQRYLVIGERLISSLVEFPQIIHIPQNGLIKSWHLVRRRNQYTNFEDCPDVD